MDNLLTREEVIALAFDRNVAVDKIKDELIGVVQQKYILPVLGEDFYDLVVATPASYTALLVYVKPYLAQMVRYHALPTIFTEVGTLGMGQTQGRNRQTSQLPELENLREQTKQVAALHAAALTKYLTDNSDLYSDYYSGHNADKGITIAGGIVFDDRGWADDDDDYTQHLKQY